MLERIFAKTHFDDFSALVSHFHHYHAPSEAHLSNQQLEVDVKGPAGVAGSLPGRGEGGGMFRIDAGTISEKTIFDNILTQKSRFAPWPSADLARARLVWDQLVVPLASPRTVHGVWGPSTSLELA